MKSSSNMQIDSWGLYLYTFKSPVTKQKYLRSLEKFLDFVDVKGENLEYRAKCFVLSGQKDYTMAFNTALKFLQFQK
ncbi:MAG TPA: hypothetical protein VH415_16040 [Nitrososphaeraceae archaeon]|jgi:hypothetical protein